MPPGNCLNFVVSISQPRVVPLLVVFVLCVSLRPAAASQHVARRIVTTSPAVTEVLFQLDLGADVVGTVEWSDYPEAAKTVPRVGPLAFPGLEAILRRRPTVVVVDETQPSPDWTAPLARAGITTMKWKPTSVAKFFASTKAMLNAVNAPASSLAELQRWETRWAERAAKCGANDRVLLLAATEPAIAFGAETFLVDAFRELGFRPVLPGTLSGFAAVGPDWLRGRTFERAFWVDFRGPSPLESLRRLVGDYPKLEGLDADAFSRPGWTALTALLHRFCREVGRVE